MHGHPWWTLCPQELEGLRLFALNFLPWLTLVLTGVLLRFKRRK